MVPVAAPHVLFAGIVTVPPELLLTVTNSPASAVPNVYAVVCALIVAVLNAEFSALAVSTAPAVKFAMPILP